MRRRTHARPLEGGPRSVDQGVALEHRGEVEQEADDALSPVGELAKADKAFNDSAEFTP